MGFGMNDGGTRYLEQDRFFEYADPGIKGKDIAGPDAYTFRFPEQEPPP
jgi:hypothetical protein